MKPTVIPRKPWKAVSVDFRGDSVDFSDDHHNNRLTFNSKEFAEFTKNKGFKHHRVTPLHPRANGEAEKFMQLLNNTKQITHMQNKDRLE